MRHITLFILLVFCTSVPAETSVIKSPVDRKSYRYLVLENQLKVLLVSDPITDKSAASLDVYVGNGSDPDGWAGLAHFLEHMLFLGTEKYPTAGEYQAYIKKNGGSNNAYTSFNHTNYFFSIGSDHLEGALDRFSRFFIDPTFDETFVDRERSVVHSEYRARKKNEFRRLWEAQKKWINPDHPASRFAVGSLETLRDREQSGVREKLIEFYNQFYSANIMALVVLGPHSLDTLEQWVTSRFSQIPNHDIEPQRFEQDYLNTELVPARLNTVTEKDYNSVSFFFPIPSTLYEFDTKPVSYIANLLGHEGKGSVYAYLKRKGWVETLSAGQGFTDKDHGIFNIRIQLTEPGLDHINDIGQKLFEYIELIKQKGIEQWRFEEQSSLGEIAFRFAQENDPGQVAQSLAARLQLYPPEQVLRGPYTMDQFDPERIGELLQYLRPDNVNIQISSKDLQTDKVTRYYNVAYQLEKLDPQWIKQWQGVVPDTDLYLPAKNPFVPGRLDILALNDQSDKPVQVPTGNDITLWYQGDNEFNTPRANFYFNIMSPVTNGSARNLVLTELLVRMVRNQLNDLVYPAYLADLNYELYRHGRGISVKVSGFEDKQSALLQPIVDALASPELDPDQFTIVKAGLLRELKNVSKDTPSNQSVHEIYRLVMQPYWTESERIAAIENISVEDLTLFHKLFFNKVKVNVLAHGDMEQQAAKSRVQLLLPLFANSEFIDHVSRSGLRTLDLEKNYLRTKSVDHTDAALSTYFQGHDNSVKERATMSLLRHLLETDFYNQLRTVNRVGYLVHAGMIIIDQAPGMFFSVQSPTHAPMELEKLYSQFIKDFSLELENMDQQQFEQSKSGLITKILRKDKNLSERSGRYWRDIDLDKTQFDSNQKLADEVNNISLDYLRAYYERTIADRGAELSVQIPGSHDAMDYQLEGSDYTVTGSAEAFRNSTL